MLLNVLIVIKFKSFQRFFQWAKIDVDHLALSLDCYKDVTVIPNHSSNFLHGLKSLMWQMVIVLQYDTLPKRFWSFSVMQTLRICCPQITQNQCSSSVLLLFHMNGYMSVSQNAV